MFEAQQRWRDGLGIKKPDFSVGEWSQLHNLAVVKLQALEDRARNYKDSGYSREAYDDMLEAQQLWSYGLNIKKPDFSAKEWLELETQP